MTFLRPRTVHLEKFGTVPKKFVVQSTVFRTWDKGKLNEDPEINKELSPVFGWSVEIPAAKVPKSF